MLANKGRARCRCGLPSRSQPAHRPAATAEPGGPGCVGARQRQRELTLDQELAARAEGRWKEGYRRLRRAVAGRGGLRSSSSISDTRLATVPTGTGASSPGTVPVAARRAAPASSGRKPAPSASAAAAAASSSGAVGQRRGLALAAPAAAGLHSAPGGAAPGWTPQPGGTRPSPLPAGCRRLLAQGPGAGPAAVQPVAPPAAPLLLLALLPSLVATAPLLLAVPPLQPRLETSTGCLPPTQSRWHPLPPHRLPLLRAHHPSPRRPHQARPRQHPWLPPRHPPPPPPPLPAPPALPARPRAAAAGPACDRPAAVRQMPPARLPRSRPRRWRPPARGGAPGRVELASLSGEPIQHGSRTRQAAAERHVVGISISSTPPPGPCGHSPCTSHKCTRQGWPRCLHCGSLHRRRRRYHTQQPQRLRRQRWPWLPAPLQR